MYDDEFCCHYDDTDDILYTISNMACDDWEIADDYGTTKEK